MKTDIYMFWLGDKEKAPDSEALNKKYKTLNFILGPSEDEHRHLLKTIPYYNQSFKRGIYSFCSDVWRFYILSKNKGFYIDTATKFGSEFEFYIEGILKYNNYFIKGNQNIIFSGYMGRFGDDKRVFEEALNRYKERDMDKYDIHCYPVGPKVITAAVRKIHKCEINHFIKQTKQYIYILDSFLITRNKRFFINEGAGSWLEGDGKNSAVKIRKKLEKQWIAGKGRPSDFLESWVLKDSLDPMMIRMKIDNSNNKQEIKKYKQIFKDVLIEKYTEWLLWTNMYRFFTMKWLKTKA